MSPLRMIYLGLAIWGAVHPMTFLAPALLETGFDWRAVLQAWRANDLVSGLFWDLLIASVTLTLWILAEVAVRRNWLALIAIPVTFGIGLGCGLPLYLFLRSRPVT
ncbi:DUF2834 domain-containing protein [Shimia sp.]|uniref:DUF2834 domain-containing protein n=1 Tax=Shimia sp. TaxID=1954381 RepID=UPI0035622B3E